MYECSVDTFWIIWLFWFVVYLSGPLLLSVCGDTDKVTVINSEFLRALGSYLLLGCVWGCLSAVGGSCAQAEVTDLDL